MPATPAPHATPPKPSAPAIPAIPPDPWLQAVGHAAAEVVNLDFALCRRRMCRRSQHCLFFDEAAGLPDCIQRAGEAPRAAFRALWADLEHVALVCSQQSPERQAQSFDVETETGRRNCVAFRILVSVQLVRRNERRLRYAVPRRSPAETDTVPPGGPRR